jgi:hypothetical protein
MLCELFQSKMWRVVMETCQLLLIKSLVLMVDVWRLIIKEDTFQSSRQQYKNKEDPLTNLKGRKKRDPSRTTQCTTAQDQIVSPVLYLQTGSEPQSRTQRVDECDRSKLTKKITLSGRTEPSRLGTSRRMPKGMTEVSRSLLEDST